VHRRDISKIPAQARLCSGTVSSAEAISVEFQLDRCSFRSSLTIVKVHSFHVAVSWVANADVVVFGNGAPSEPYPKRHRRG
jgi:hypothetical protein